MLINMINTDISELLILRKKTSNRHIFTKSFQLEPFVSCWKESHSVIHQVLKFLMIYVVCLANRKFRFYVTHSPLTVISLANI